MCVNSYKFFENKDCKFFPCHDIEGSFNCLWCYCPLYSFEKCDGNYKKTKNGIKDCSFCLIPHLPDNYDYIIKKLKKI